MLINKRICIINQWVCHKSYFVLTYNIKHIHINSDVLYIYFFEIGFRYKYYRIIKNKTKYV